MSYWKSTIGRKQLLGLAGLGLCLFILTHMLGNLLIFVGAETYNMYAHSLVSNPFIYVAEVGLLGLFVLHIVLAIVVTLLNKKARPVSYAVSPKGDKATSLAAKTMIHQGVIVLVFVIHHLITFKFGPMYFVNYSGLVVRDLFKLLQEVFQSPLYAAWYVVAVVVLGLHLSHGFASSIKTLGFNHPRFNSTIEKMGKFYACIVVVGFVAQPLYIFFLLP